eukprot:tig00020510_g9867.t1
MAEADAFGALDPAAAEALRAMQQAMRQQQSAFAARVALLEGAVQDLSERKADAASVESMQERLATFSGFSYQHMLEALRQKDEWLEEGISRLAGSIHKLEERKADRASLAAFTAANKHFQDQINKVTDLISCKIDRSELVLFQKMHDALAETLSHFRSQIEEHARMMHEMRGGMFALDQRVTEAELLASGIHNRIANQDNASGERVAALEARLAAAEAELAGIAAADPSQIARNLAALDERFKEFKIRHAAGEAAAAAWRGELDGLRSEWLTEASIAPLRAQARPPARPRTRPLTRLPSIGSRPVPSVSAFAHDLGMLHQAVQVPRAPNFLGRLPRSVRERVSTLRFGGGDAGRALGPRPPRPLARPSPSPSPGRPGTPSGGSGTHSPGGPYSPAPSPGPGAVPPLSGATEEAARAVEALERRRLAQMSKIICFGPRRLRRPGHPQRPSLVRVSNGRAQGYLLQQGAGAATKEYVNQQIRALRDEVFAALERSIAERLELSQLKVRARKQ